MPAEVQRAAWPTEDYHLARSLVDAGTARGRPVRRDPGEGEPVIAARGSGCEVDECLGPAGHPRASSSYSGWASSCISCSGPGQAPAEGQRGSALEALQAEALQADGRRPESMPAKSMRAEPTSAESIPAEALQDQGSAGTWFAQTGPSADQLIEPTS